jgi:hypothetical protein
MEELDGYLLNIILPDQQLLFCSECKRRNLPESRHMPCIISEPLSPEMKYQIKNRRLTAKVSES